MVLESFLEFFKYCLSYLECFGVILGVYCFFGSRKGEVYNDIGVLGCC